MFCLNENFFSEFFQLVSFDFYGKFFLLFFGVLLFLEGIRNQVSEIEILQLVPGFFFFLCFVLFFLFFILSELFLRVPSEIDAIQSLGTKTKHKIEFTILLKLAFFLFSNLCLLMLNTILPLSLDYFNNSDEKTLESIWSLDQVIFFELIVFLLLVLISQSPLFFIINFNTKKISKILSRFWKLVILSMTLAAGFLTPTLDGSTQLNFAGFTVSFYLFIVNFLQKKLFIKLNTFLPFGG